VAVDDEGTHMNDKIAALTLISPERLESLRFHYRVIGRGRDSASVVDASRELCA